MQHTLSPVLLGPFIFGFLLAAKWVTGQASVSLGADGIRFVRPSRKARFVAFTAIEEAEALGGEAPGVSLRLRTGESIVLRFQGTHGRLRDLRVEERDDLLQRIKEARGRCETSTVAAGAENLIGRRGRSLADWLRALRDFSQEAGYRAASVTADHLWQLVEDPALQAHLRAGAATALAPSLDDKGRGRLRVAADACAEPRLRVALDAVAEGAKDAVLEDALGALEEEPPAPRTTSANG